MLGTDAVQISLSNEAQMQLSSKEVPAQHAVTHRHAPHQNRRGHGEHGPCSETKTHLGQAPQLHGSLQGLIHSCLSCHSLHQILDEVQGLFWNLVLDFRQARLHMRKKKNTVMSNSSRNGFQLSNGIQETLFKVEIGDKTANQNNLPRLACAFLFS